MKMTLPVIFIILEQNQNFEEWFFIGISYNHQQSVDLTPFFVVLGKTDSL